MSSDVTYEAGLCPVAAGERFVVFANSAARQGVRVMEDLVESLLRRRHDRCGPTHARPRALPLGGPPTSPASKSGKLCTAIAADAHAACGRRNKHCHPVQKGRKKNAVIPTSGVRLIRSQGCMLPRYHCIEAPTRNSWLEF